MNRTLFRIIAGVIMAGVLFFIYKGYTATERNLFAPEEAEPERDEAAPEEAEPEREETEPEEAEPETDAAPVPPVKGTTREVIIDGIIYEVDETPPPPVIVAKSEPEIKKPIEDLPPVVVEVSEPAIKKPIEEPPPPVERNFNYYSEPEPVSGVSERRDSGTVSESDKLELRYISEEGL